MLPFICGEELTILLPMTTCAEGVVIAERIRTEFKKERFPPEPGQAIHLTVSIGPARYKMKEEMKAFVHQEQFKPELETANRRFERAR